MKNVFLSFFIIVFLFGCRNDTPRYVIGVSQCSDDEWRHKMNSEILREALFYESVEVEILSAADSNEKQVADVEYFRKKKVDLLIIAPNEAAPMTPVVEQVFNDGIPVVVVDRKILSDKYTAYVGADNYEIGKAVGDYVVNRLNKKGTVIEITGLEGSSPAIDRHQGFINAIKDYPHIKLLQSIDAGWSQDIAAAKMDTVLRSNSKVDLIFAQNDRMALGAYRSWEKSNQDKIIFIGIDALPSKEYGINQVLNKELDATFIYPTGGDIVMQVAMSILQKSHFDRENILSTAVVDSTNAKVMKLQTDHIAEQDHKIEVLNFKIDDYLSRYKKQQIILYASLIILVLVTGILFLIYKVYRSKNRMNNALSKRNDEITSQKEQLEEHRDQLIILSKQLEEATHAKLVFFTNISHDFRTPLTLVSDPVEILLADNQLNEKQKKLLIIVRKNVNILLRLVNQILDFRKYENGKLELVLSRNDLKSLITEWNHSFQTIALKKHIKFSFNADEGSYSMPMDVEKIERIYFNLLSNAFKFTPEKGKISVSLHHIIKNNNVRHIRLSISDTGIGFSVEYIRNIFDRFYKIDLHYAGSGIGLALVKAFVEVHGGEVLVDSYPGEGSVFTIDIPCEYATFIEQEDVQSSSENKLEHLPLQFPPSEEFSHSDDFNFQSQNQDRETILIIDDNTDIREYVRSFLQNDYTLIEASDGRDGFIKAMKYVPDVILCDIVMPVMDGIECCKRLKSEMQTCHIPVILLTSCTLDEQMVQGFESGADSYISKPFNSKVLKVRIRNLMENHKRMKQFFGDTTTLAKELISDLDKNFVERFKKLIEENLSKSELNIEELGRNMGMSRVQLYRKTKSLTHYSPNELLRIARLKKAASLLSSSEMTIAEITYAVGFSSPSYFTKCYKEYFGEIPTDFLKRKG